MFTYDYILVIIYSLSSLEVLFIEVTINATHFLLSTLLGFYATFFRFSRYYTKSNYSLGHLNAMRINESESRTAGNEKFHRRIKMAFIYRVTIVLNFMSYLPTKIGDLSQKLFRLENVSKRNTRVRYCAIAATDWLVRLHQRYPLRTYQPSYHPLLLPFVPSPLTIFS